MFGDVVCQTLTAAVGSPTPSPAPQDTGAVSWPSLIWVAAVLLIAMFLFSRYLKKVLGRP